MSHHSGSHWALSKFYRDKNGVLRNFAGDYGQGCINPRFHDDLMRPDLEVTEQGHVKNVWGLVLVHDFCVEGALTSPNVQPYHTVYDTITPETVKAYATQGAEPGMMLCQLLAKLAKWEPAFRHAINEM